jgi:hypothetical protein
VPTTGTHSRNTSTSTSDEAIARKSLTVHRGAPIEVSGATSSVMPRALDATNGSACAPLVTCER